MHAAFLEAAAPEPFRVLGRNLKPFTIGHQLLLERFESGYAVGSTVSPSWDDFIFSVWTCSQSYADVLKALASRVTLVRVYLWSKRCGKFDVREAQQFFNQYLEANTSEPMYFYDDTKAGDALGIPWGLYLKQMVQEKLHLNEAEAVNYPYRQASLLYLRQLAERGMIKFGTDHDIALQEAAQRFNAQKVGRN